MLDRGLLAIEQEAAVALAAAQLERTKRENQ